MSHVRPPIRTVTVGVELAGVADVEGLRRAVTAARLAGDELVRAGCVVQSLRVATGPLQGLPGGDDPESLLAGLARLDRVAAEEGILLSVGPVEPLEADRFSQWAARLAVATSVLSFSVQVAQPGLGVIGDAVARSAEAMLAIAERTPGGEGNFRFAAAANVPAGTPFFPVAHHEGADALALGLELPGLLSSALEGERAQHPLERLAAALESELVELERLAASAAAGAGLAYTGIDVSPAPGLEASIAAVIEALSGRPFGGAGTLAVCASLTAILSRVGVRTCGYSGLMLPVLEDVVLARRAEEGRFGVQELLLYSSVCGTGLDVVPLPGDVGAAPLAALVGDMAALSVRLAKPLSARLFPIPGRAAGDRVDFENPHLTAARIMALE